MATYKRPLIDKQQNTIHPITCTKAVYDDEGRDLDELLKIGGYHIEINATSTVISAQVSRSVLTAKVYNGPADITANFMGNDYIFKWTRTSTDAAADAIWNNDRDHYGPGMNTLTVTEQDILYSATYTCGLYNND